MIRKPVATAVLGGLLVVICDDGTLWEYDPNGRWLEREPIPGTAAGIRIESGRRYQGPEAPAREGGYDRPSYRERRERERRGRRDDRVPERRDGRDRRGRPGRPTQQRGRHE